MTWYRKFVYLSGGVAQEGKASIPGIFGIFAEFLPVPSFFFKRYYN